MYIRGIVKKLVTRVKKKNKIIESMLTYHR